MVSLDAFDDPFSLALDCRVNDEVRQSDNTGDVIFDIPNLIAFLSGICTPQAGGITFTGTPGGVALRKVVFSKTVRS